MKKIIIIIFILIISILLIFTIKPKKDNNLKTVKLAEVTHSLFYTPMYVAIENGYFKEEGLNIELTLVSGADKVSAAVISGDSDIGFAGAEATIYIYNGKEEDYLVNFAGLTKRDGQFLVGRKKEDFNLKLLENKEILVGRIGGMPSLNFLNALHNNNIDQKSININYSVDFAALSGTFIAGVGDYVNLFEPNATKLENLGIGYILGSIGQLSGEMPYTTYFAKKSYIENNKDIIIKFRNAINKGLEFVRNNDSNTIANIINKQFVDSSINETTKIIDRYKKYDTWLDNTYISEESFKNLEDLMIRNKLLDNYVDYNLLVNNE